MCLGEYGTVVELLDGGRALVACGGVLREVSLAVLVAERVPVGPGDVVLVSIGMALRLADGTEPIEEVVR